jgi:hypothetical protein
MTHISRTLPTAIVSAVVATFVGAATPSMAHVQVAVPHALHLKVSALDRPCGKKYLVGKFTITGLRRGQSQIDASTSSGGVLLHTFSAKTATVTIKAKLKYQFPKGAPVPSGPMNIYVVQGTRQPSPAVTKTVTGCKK